MKYIRPKNWGELQHYKDRAPPWIKLHKHWLDDQEFNALDGFSTKVLVLFWVLASENQDGWVEYNPPKIAFRMRLSTVDVSVSLDILLASGLIVSNTETEAVADGATASAAKMREAAGWGSRHISDEVKREVWARDGGCCVLCSSVNAIEYDHIIPVSRGGNSEARNVQLLCRQCNRKKRVSVPVEQGATQAQPDLNMRTTEKETQVTSEETESISAKVAAPVAVAPLPEIPIPKFLDRRKTTPHPINGHAADFQSFYDAYPLHKSRRSAEKAYVAALKRAPPAAILAGAIRYAADPDRKPDFTKHPATWLNADGWADDAENTTPINEFVRRIAEAESKVET